jgi:hypothetical protein
VQADSRPHNVLAISCEHAAEVFAQPKVRGEFSLTVLAYNLKRVLNIVGVPRLLEALA